MTTGTPDTDDPALTPFYVMFLQAAWRAAADFRDLPDSCPWKKCRDRKACHTRFHLTEDTSESGCVTDIDTLMLTIELARFAQFIELGGHIWDAPPAPPAAPSETSMAQTRPGAKRPRKHSGTQRSRTKRRAHADAQSDAWRREAEDRGFGG